jgi:hypothetical protein
MLQRNTRFSHNVKLLSSLFWFIVMVGCFVLIPGQKAAAIGPQYYDDTGSGCDVSKCGTTQIRLTAGQTRYVQKTGVNLVAYFAQNNGDLTVEGGNFCPATLGNPDGLQAGDYFGDNPGSLADGTNITKFTVNGVTKYGVYDSTAGPNCTAPITFNGMKNLTPDPNTGLFYATIVVDPVDKQPGSCTGSITTPNPNIVGCDGIMNYFYIHETSASSFAIAQKGGTSGYEVTAQQTDNTSASLANVTYSVKFGADCSVDGTKSYNLSYYDMDNDGGKGAQLNGQITMVLKDADTGAVLDQWIPNSDNNATGTHAFTPKKDGKYIWEFQNVYVNNTIQFSTPFDGIYALRTCADTFPPVPPLPPPPPRPFFQVTGGDIVAGASIATGVGSPCTGTGAAPHLTDAGITSWNNDGLPDFAGAGSEYAAFALNYIQDFVTKQGIPGSSETNQLTFSNKNNAGSVDLSKGLFGGMFGTAPCADYWTSKPADITKLTTVNNGSVSSATSGNYSHIGSNLSLATSTIGNGRHVTIYVEGDVAITGNITYPAGASYSDRSDIPSFRLIVHGRIFIGANVTQLDGLYVAVPDAGYADSTVPAGKPSTFSAPKAGTISTCSVGFTSLDPTALASNNFASVCGNPLTVNGSVVAEQLWLLRTRGSLNSGIPAEVFNYSPEVWLAPSAGAGGVSGVDYQSVIGLPPVL